MELAVTVKTAREGVKALADKGDELGFLAWQFANKKATTIVTVSVAEFDLESLQIFYKVMKDNDEDDAAKVQKLIKSLKDTENNKVTKLVDFPRFFKEYLKANDNPLLHSLHTELRGIAYLPTAVNYHPERRDRHYVQEAYVEVVCEYNTKMQNRKYSFTLHQRDMQRSVPAILRAENLMAPDETMLADYKKIKKRFEEYGGIEAGRIQSIIDPRLADHVRREALKFVDELRRVI